MYKLTIKLADGKFIQGEYRSMFRAYEAADSYDLLSKRCKLAKIEYADIREL